MRLKMCGLVFFQIAAIWCFIRWLLKPRPAVKETTVTYTPLVIYKEGDALVNNRLVESWYVDWVIPQTKTYLELDENEKMWWDE